MTVLPADRKVGSLAFLPFGPRTQRSARPCRVKHDLIVFPELLEEPADIFLVARLRSDPLDLIDRAVAVDCGEDSLLCRIYGEGEVGVNVGPIDQNGRRTGGHPVADAQGPRQTQRNIGRPGVTVERDRLALANAIVAISDEVVRDHRSAQQLDGGVLQSWRKRAEACGMRYARHCSALREIGGLLVPTPE